jgi:predicted nucleotidyltransferase
MRDADSAIIKGVIRQVEQNYSLSRLPEPSEPTGEIRRQELLQRVQGLDELWQAFGLRRVWVYGSILSPQRFRTVSDIDVLVDGAGSQVFQLAAEVERRIGWSVDLLDIELVSVRLRERAQRQGKLIYAA